MKRLLPLFLTLFLSLPAMADMIGSDMIGVEAASSDGPFVTIGNDAGLTQERALTGTTNEITVTDNGANSTVVLDTPQALDTGADFQVDTIKFGTDRTYDVTFDSSTSATESYTCTWPVDKGTADQVVATNGSGVLSWVTNPVGSAPVGSAFVTVGADGTLTAERALTGTSNQITITDNGANSTIVASTPQNLDAGADFLVDTLKFGTDRTYTVTFDSSTSATESYTATWPVDNGAANEFLKTDGAGTLDFAMIDISDSTNLLGTANQVILTGDELSTPQNLDTGADFQTDTILFGTDKTFDVTFDSSTSATESYALTWPVDKGAANEILVVDGSGILDFATLGGDVTGTVAVTVVGNDSHDHTNLTGTTGTTWIIDSDNGGAAVAASTGIVLEAGSGTNWTWGSNSASTAFEAWMGAAGTTIAMGRTTDTGQSEIVIVDGGADNEPGTIQTYTDGGTGYRWWVASSGVPRIFNSAIVDDDTDGNAFVLDNTALGGDATGTVGAVAVTDDSHAHTGTTLSSIDISDDTNLTGTANQIVLTGDTLSTPQDIATGSSPTFSAISLSNTISGHMAGDAIALSLRGNTAGGQTLPLTRWREDSTGRTFSIVDSEGRFEIDPGFVVGATPTPLGDSGTAAVSIWQPGTGTEALVLKQKASATDNVFEVLDSSNNIMAGVTKDTNLFTQHESAASLTALATAGEIKAHYDSDDDLPFLVVRINSVDQKFYPVRMATTVRAGSLVLPTSGMPASSTVERTTAVAIELAFDDASTECGWFQFDLPKQFQDKDVVVCPDWYSSTATSGDVKWDIQYNVLTDSDVYGTEALTSTSFAITTDGTAIDLNRGCSTLTSPFAVGTGMVNGKFCRNGGSTDDTMTGDARLVSIGFQEDD